MTQPKNKTGVSIPWVEKYRPNIFDNIVLNSVNKTICTNIVDMKHFPHLLLYGPPGTGKTTTIINLISKYQEHVGQTNKELVIQLNASDERGIDIIRNQILQFVNSKCLFASGLKFVILDEVDYMTKNAQHALRYLINTYGDTVRFCLICNYISRIDEGLQTEFLKIRFNNLPQHKIYEFLKNIIVQENILINDEKIAAIQQTYGSDIRSMINFIQCNHILDPSDIIIIDGVVWENLTVLLKKIDADKYKTYQFARNYLHQISATYNITCKNSIHDYVTYLIKHKKIQITSEFLMFVEKIVHCSSINDDEVFINYVLASFDRFSGLL